MIFDVYCDESRQDLLVNNLSVNKQNRYCCIGGLMLPTEKRESIKHNIKELRQKYGVFGELKWGTVSTNKLPFYLELIDLFFETEKLDFKTIVIDAEMVDNNSFNNSDHELGYYKFYYQLLIHWLKFDNTYRVYTDFKTNKEKNRLEELKKYVNKTGIKERIILIQAINSKESSLLQLQNVIMGAVGYKFNYSDTGSSIAKLELIKEIEKHLECKIEPTEKKSKKINIFKIELKKGERK